MADSSSTSRILADGEVRGEVHYLYHSMHIDFHHSLSPTSISVIVFVSVQPNIAVRTQEQI